MIIVRDGPQWFSHRPCLQTYQDGLILAPFLPDKLADVDHTPGVHAGRTGIPDVRVVLPDDGLALGACHIVQAQPLGSGPRPYRP